MRIVALGAHPDDIEYGCGGTLALLSAAGHEVFLLICTAGEQGHIGEQTANPRTAEQEHSARLLGARDILWLDYPDTSVPVDREIISSVETHLDRIRPEYVFVHHGQDTHQDHRNLSQVAVSATRKQRNVLFYEGPTTHTFTPTVFVDITTTIERKLEALTAHRSQLTQTNIAATSILELARATSMFRGTQARTMYAESFVPLRLFLDFD